jgi:hypothetical protein
MEMKPTPFTFLNSINEGLRGKDVFGDISIEEKAYPSFMVNRGLSYFADTCLFANEMNKHPAIPGRSQYEFLRRTIRPSKRFAKWLKADSDADMDIIKRAYGYSSDKARAVRSLFTREMIDGLKASMDRGGKA